MINENAASYDFQSLPGYDHILQLYESGFEDSEIILEGPDFDGKITTVDIQYLSELQRFIYKLYALVKYSSFDLKKLKGHDLKDLTFKFSVTKGSAKIKIEFGGVTKKLSEAIDKLSNKEIRTIVIFAMVLTFSGFGLKYGIHSYTQIQIAKIENDPDKSSTRKGVLIEQLRESIPASQKDIEAFELLEEIAAENKQLRELLAETHTLIKLALAPMMRSTKSEMNGIKVTGLDAKRLLLGTVPESDVINLDGIYDVRKIQLKQDTPKEHVYEVELRSHDKNLSNMKAEIYMSAVRDDSLEILTKSLIHQIPIYVKSYGRQRAHKIVYAEITGVAEIEAAGGD